MDSARYVEDDSKAKKRDFGKRKDGKRDKKDRGYTMFAEDDSAEESLVTPEDNEYRPQSKLKKHSKPSFKFAKKEKSYKPKEKEEKKKDEKKKEDKFKLKKKRPLTEGTKAPAEKPLFGVPLALVVSRNKSCDGVQLPSMFRECIDYIEEFGLTCEGIYRISGVKSKVQALKDAYNKGVPVSLQEYEPNVVAGLLKQFLRELPEPVLTADMTVKFELASTNKSVKQKVGEFQRLIELLPTPNRLLLSWVIIHMTHVIAQEKQNKMSMQNVSIVLSPTMQISHRVLNILFTYSKILFKDTVIRRYVPPLRPVTSKWSLELPESPSSLQDELRKQELLLDDLHKDVMGVKDTEKEERLWEVQRVITGLKRKLKMIKKSQQSPSFLRSLERNKDISYLRAEPPKHLNLKLGGEELDLRSADTLPVTVKQPQSDVTKVADASSPTSKGLATKSDTPSPDKGIAKSDAPSASKSVTKVDSSVSGKSIAKADTPTATKGVTKADTPSSNKTTAKRVSKKAVITPTADSGMDIGDIELDVSAMSHSQKQRADHVIKADTQPPVDIAKQETVATEKSKGDDTAAVGKAKSSPGQKSIDKSDSSPAEVSESRLKERLPSVEVDATKTASDTTVAADADVITTPRSSPTVANINEGASLESKPEVVSEAKRPDVLEVKSRDDEDRMASARAEAVNVAATGAGIDQIARAAPAPSKHTPAAKHRKSSAPAAMASEHIADSANQRRSLHPPQDGVAADELAAALSELASSETEEERNQRIMSQFVADFGIEKPAECDEEYDQLLEEYTALMLEEEELAIIGDEIRSKIESEQYEAERLDEELVEIRAMREDLYSSDEKTDSSDDSDSEDDEETLLATLGQLLAANAQLQADNEDLCNKTYQEVQDCLKTKVQIRMIQQQQLESSKNNELDLLL